MPIYIAGIASGQTVEVDSTWKAMRTSLRPIDHGSGGHYRIAQFSGAMGSSVTANTSIASFRNGSASLNCLVWYIKWTWFCTVFNTAQLVDHALYIGRSFSGNYTGGTAATLSGNNCKKRTSYATTAVADIRIASTASFSGGTITLDTQPIMYRASWVAAVGDGLKDSSQSDFEMEQESPLVFAQNEGFALQAVTAISGTNNIKLGLEIAWSEVPTGTF